MHNQAVSAVADPTFHPGQDQEWSCDLADIVSVVSYELRTPITAVRASLGLLLAELCGTLSEQGRRLLEIALNNTERLLKLAEALEQEPETIAPTAATLEVEDRTQSALKQRLAFLRTWRQQVGSDQLTGLPTQPVVMSQMGHAWQRFQQDPHQTFAVLVLGLDDFQIVNDSLGYVAANQLLAAIAQRLLGHLPEPATIARLASDKFVILLPAALTLGTAVSTAEALQQALATAFVVEDQELFVTASIGIAWPEVGQYQAEDWLHNADTAMHRAKAMGKAHYTIFKPELRREANSRLRLESDLRGALERQEFRLHYQPIMSLKKGEIAGFEALIRWQHPEEGLVMPSKFIPLLEETGLVTSVGHWVLSEACQQLQSWQQRFPQNSPLTMSVNLAMQQLTHPDLVQQVQEILEATQLAPHSLKLEITESAVMDNPDHVISTLQQLKNLGIQISIDDFGTGYSSLAYLYQLPIDTLKIDQSFIRRLDQEFEHLEIVKTIGQLAWNLGMEVVAEGIETKQQMEQLKRLGCDFGQGYFFSKPMDSQSAEWLVCELSQPLLSSHPAA